MIALTQEQRQKRIDWLKQRISSMEQCRDEIPFGLSEDETMELAAYKDSLASLTAEPVAYTSGWALSDVFTGDSAMMGKWNEVGKIPLFTVPPVPDINEGDYFSKLVKLARERAEKAISKFPQPNYVLNKVAEESGEVIKAVIHFTEGRETWENVEYELIDNLAMLIRLVIEGDGIIGFNIPEHIKRLNGLGE